MRAARNARHALFGLIFFLSGAAGLVYELVWVRELYQFFGSTIHSVTTVVAAYMGGLGLGAYVLGRRADRHPRPQRLYGLLELAVGAFGLASPWVLRWIGVAYLEVARTLVPGLWTATAIKFAFAFTVLLVPTFLMGGTLPVLTRAFAGERSEELRGQLALFYGLNTVGGVVGCAAAGYVLIELVGLERALVGTGLLNLALGASALALARLPAPVRAEREAAAGWVSSDAGPRLRRLAVWLIGLTAFASLLYEIAWTRVLILVVGSSTYAFTTILACFLLGLGLGSLVALGRGRAPLALLRLAGLVQGVIALLAALLFPFFRVLPVYVIATLQVPFFGARALLLLHGLAVAVVVVPPAVGMGLSFPLLAELASERTGATGREVGRAYFANTVGSIGGAVVTGFVLIHLLGSERTLELGVLINVAAALALGAGALAYGSRRGDRLGTGLERIAAVVAVLAVAVAFVTPRWSGRLLDRGAAIYGRRPMNSADLGRFLRGYGSEQLFFEEGWNSAVSVWRDGGQTWLKVNGKVDASSVADMDTQVMLGLLPALAHPAPHRAFVVGFGSGATTRTLADVPGVTRIDVAEIERAVVRASRLFDDLNRGVLADPRVRVINDDARSALMLADTAYDLIVSEPSNPWIAGVASLYTRDYFRVVDEHLAPDGVFCQWLQMYRVTPGLVAVVVANLRAVFPHVEVWFSNSSDLMVLAARRRFTWDSARVAALFQPGSATGTAMREWLLLRQPGDLLGHFLLGERGSALLARGAPFAHTDDRPALEFVAARSLLAEPSGDVFDSLVALKEDVADSMPTLSHWHPPPGAWRAAYARALPPEMSASLAAARQAIAAAPGDAARAEVLGRVLLARGNARDAVPYLLRAWAARKEDDPDVLLALGRAWMDVGDSAQAEPLLERVAGGADRGDSVAALALLADIAAGRGDYGRAATLAARAITALAPSLARPFPESLEETLVRLADHASPAVAAPLFALTTAARPAWQFGVWGAAVVNARAGGAACAAALRSAAELARFGWTRAETAPLVARCR